MCVNLQHVNELGGKFTNPLACKGTSDGNSEEAQSGLDGVRGAFGSGGPGLAPRFISYVTWSRLLGLF